MSRGEYSDDCPGCLPVVMGLDGKVNQRATALAVAVFKETTLPVRQAFHRVTCDNSRNAADLKLANLFFAKLQEVLDKKGATA
jgi:hypothetical protein